MPGASIIQGQLPARRAGSNGRSARAAPQPAGNVTTPRLTSGQWEAFLARGRGRRSWAAEAVGGVCGFSCPAAAERPPLVRPGRRFPRGAGCPAERRRELTDAPPGTPGSTLPFARTSSCRSAVPAGRAGWRPGGAAGRRRDGCSCSCCFRCSGPRPGSAPAPTKT